MLMAYVNRSRLPEYFTLQSLPPTALVNAGEEVDLHRLFAGI
jgi:hypothetical protein